MPAPVLADVSMPSWINTATSVLGLCVAMAALLTSRRTAQAAREANEISRGANQLAELALKRQEDESQVRLVVKPRLMRALGDEEDSRRRPVVEVINLSAFPVTITDVHWKTNRDQKAWLYWKNPTICEPYGRLPARLPPREALTAIGTPTSFQSLDDLRAIMAAVAFTACGERIAGMTNEWLEDVRNTAG